MRRKLAIFPVQTGKSAGSDLAGSTFSEKIIAEGGAQAAAGRIHMAGDALVAVLHGQVRLGGGLARCEQAQGRDDESADDICTWNRSARFMAVRRHVRRCRQRCADSTSPLRSCGRSAPALIHCRMTAIVAAGKGGPPKGICAPVAAWPSSFWMM